MTITSTDRTRAARKRGTTSGRNSGQPSGARRDRGHQAAVTARALRALQQFRMIFGSARRFDADVRRSTGISGSLLWALAEIAGSEGLRVNGLAECMALHQTTASNIVNALVERKLIRRVRNASDQRMVHLHISAQGRRVLQRAPGPHVGLLLDALRRLDGIRLEQLENGLSALVGLMRGGAAARAAGETLLGE